MKQEPDPAIGEKSNPTDGFTNGDDFKSIASGISPPEFILSAVEGATK